MKGQGYTMADLQRRWDLTHATEAAATPVVVTYRNVNRLSTEVPETAHDGHAVRLVRPLTPAEQDAEVGQMWAVYCTADGQQFHVFPEEITP